MKSRPSQSFCSESTPVEQDDPAPIKPRSAYHTFVLQQVGKQLHEISALEHGSLLAQWRQMPEIERQLRKRDRDLQMVKYRQQLSEWRSSHMRAVWRKKAPQSQLIDIQNADRNTRESTYDTSQAEALNTEKSEELSGLKSHNQNTDEHADIKIEEPKIRNKNLLLKSKRFQERALRKSTKKGEKITRKDLNFMNRLFSVCFGSSSSGQFKLPGLNFTITGKIAFSQQI